MKREKELPLLSLYRWLDAGIRDVRRESGKDNYEPNYKCQNNICVVLDKGMGDFILFAHYLKEFIRHYGEKLYIIADTYNVEFLKAYLSIGMERVIVLKTGLEVTVEGKQLISYRGKFERAYVPMNAVSPRTAEILRILSPAMIISLGNNLFLRKYSRKDYCLFKYIESAGIQKDFYCKMHREYHKKYLGGDVGLILDEPKISDRLVDEDYFLVNISASNRVHLPSLDLYIEVAEALRGEYGLKPILTGDCSDDEKNIIVSKGYDTRFINIRNMKVTISLCNYSTFVISADTGIYHLSMSLKRDFPVFVISWGYINVLFEPYPDELNGGRLHYIQLYENCRCCKYNKAECWINRRLKRTVKCIRNITSKEVLSQIREKLSLIAANQ